MGVIYRLDWFPTLPCTPRRWNDFQRHHFGFRASNVPLACDPHRIYAVQMAWLPLHPFVYCLPGLCHWTGIFVDVIYTVSVVSNNQPITKLERKAIYGGTFTAVST